MHLLPLARSPGGTGFCTLFSVLMMAPRYSLIPGRFVEDTRPDHNHYKVLCALGRHTDDEGWCRIKQSRVGEAVSLSRETVCRKLRDLVEWGYVQKEDEDGSGRAIWYRILLDAPTKPPGWRATDGGEAPVKPRSQVPPVTDASQVGGRVATTCEAPITPGVTPANHTRCDAPRHSINDPSQRPSLTDSPPSPSQPVDSLCESGGWASGWTSEARGILTGMRSNASLGHVVTAFVDPVRGTLRPQKGADPAAFVRQVAHRLRDFSPEALARAADAMLATRGGFLPAAAEIARVASAAAAEIAREAARAGQHAPAVAGPADPAAVAAWSTVAERLKAAIGAVRFDAWFLAVGPVSLADGVLTVRAPSPFHAREIDREFATALAAAGDGVARVSVTSPTARRAAA